MRRSTALMVTYPMPMAYNSLTEKTLTPAMLSAIHKKKATVAPVTMMLSNPPSMVTRRGVDSSTFGGLSVGRWYVLMPVALRLSQSDELADE